MSVKSTTVRLNTDIDPVWIGARSGLLWHRSDLTLAGIGEAKRIGFQRPDGVEDAMAQLAEIDETSDESILAPGRGLVAFSALPFAPDAPGELIVPELVVGQDRSGRRWLTVVDDTSLSTEQALGRLEVLLPTLEPETGIGSSSNYTIEAVPAPDVWRDDVVRVARDSIVDGELAKAVMARRLVVTTDREIDVPQVVHNLVDVFPTAVVFNVEGFVGASPELLVARSDDMVHSHPLAGTAPRSSEPSVDTRLIADLLASTKDRWEHKITIDWLLDTLLPFCSYVDAEPEPSVVTLANVHHLGTMVEGRLSRPHPSVLELVSALHPTPAVGGDPQSTALDLIGKLEGESRHRYAGPTGWVDGQGNGSFVVAIRSAEIAGTTATLRAGVGVVADSDPSAELEETRNKFRAMLSALIRP